MAWQLNPNQSEVVFFLGAGASVHADVPDTLGMVQKFEEHIRQWPRKSKTIETITEILRQRKPPHEPVDVELLLETLERLEKKEQDEILWFYELGKFALEGYSDKRPLTDELKDFIKAKAVVEASKIRYLEPLLEFIEEKPLDIFSVNYDTCIEQFCDTYRKDLQDGFDLYWNPETFGRKTDVRLYKLHGSVTWYRSDKGRYLKIPILSESSTIELVSREKAESLVLYPFRKWTYAEPMLELLVELKRKLDVASYVFVVGYSFRDEHIRRLFWDAANRNRNLVLLLIGPHAHETYNSKLRYYDQETASGASPIPSSLEGRVVVLPYKFEDILPRLKNKILFDLRNGQNAERDVRAAEIKGQPTSWSAAIWYFAECEYTSKVMQLLAKTDSQGLEWSRNVEISIKMLISAICQGDDNLAHLWAQKLIDATPWLLEQCVFIQVSIRPPKIVFGLRQTKDSYLATAQIRGSVEIAMSLVKTRIELVAVRDGKQKLQRILDALTPLWDYITEWGDDGIDLPSYVASRANSYPQQIAVIADILKGMDPRNYDEQALERAKALSEEIEKTIVRDMITQFRKAVSSTTSAVL
jgi:hypothetical protein